MKLNEINSNEENIIFELNDDVVFETALATLQHSIVG